MKKVIGLLRLIRPANIVTAIADVLAGVALSGLLVGISYADFSTTVPQILLLCLSTIGLYGGGIVFNDVFDYELDKIERPERTIPSGLVSLKEATAWGSVLLVFAILFAFSVNTTAGCLAILTSISALVYNKWGKHHSFLGPPNMGLCRGLNLLLGVSILPHVLPSLIYVAVVPILYISAITLISRGEVHGSSKKPLYTAAFLYALVVLLILVFAVKQGMLIPASLFILGFSYMVYRPLLKAMDTPSGPAIGRAVKSGVMALILMNASWAAASGAFILACFIVLLLPISIWLSKQFAVT